MSGRVAASYWDEATRSALAADDGDGSPDLAGPGRGAGAGGDGDDGDNGDASADEAAPLLPEMAAAMVLAAQAGELDTLRELMEEWRAGADVMDDDGTTPLIAACASKPRESSDDGRVADTAAVVTYLLSRGADAAHVQHRYGWTAVTACCVHGNNVALELLLAARPPPSAASLALADAEGRAPAEHARAQREFYEELLEQDFVYLSQYEKSKGAEAAVAEAHAGRGGGGGSGGGGGGGGGLPSQTPIAARAFQQKGWARGHLPAPEPGEERLAEAVARFAQCEERVAAALGAPTPAPTPRRTMRTPADRRSSYHAQAVVWGTLAIFGGLLAIVGAYASYTIAVGLHREFGGAKTPR